MAADLALTLPPDASAPGVARAATKRYLADKVHPERMSELTLVISELVSNAWLHGRGQIVLRLQLDDEVVRGEVIDQGAGFEREVRARGPEEVGGRGLFLVDALTNRWGIHEGTTHVWFEIQAAATHAGGPTRGSAKTSALTRSTDARLGPRRLAGVRCRRLGGGVTRPANGCSVDTRLPQVRWAIFAVLTLGRPLARRPPAVRAFCTQEWVMSMSSPKRPRLGRPRLRARLGRRWPAELRRSS